MCVLLVFGVACVSCSVCFLYVLCMSLVDMYCICVACVGVLCVCCVHLYVVHVCLNVVCDRMCVVR